MARIYANLIIKKRRTIEQVPKMFKDETLKILEQDGYNGYGEPLV